MAGGKREAVALESYDITTVASLTDCGTSCNLYEPQFPICKMGVCAYLLYKVVIKD